MRAFEGWISAIADAWWVHLVVLALSFVDGFFPTVPSESVIVSLGSTWSSTGRPSIVLLVLAAWAGAFCGDNVAYLIGRRIGWQRFRFFREGKGRRAVEAAERGLRRRALVFLMTARYIPFGRTAVNLVAGAVRYPRDRYVPRVALSTAVWAVYSAAVGAVAGQWFEHNPLLGIGVALACAVVISLVVERVVSAVHDALDRRADAREARHGTAGHGTADHGAAGHGTAGHGTADHKAETDAASGIRYRRGSGSHRAPSGRPAAPRADPVPEDRP
ncbi:DedA family protein [Brachybacterium huguangmaarense]